MITDVLMMGNQAITDKNQNGQTNMAHMIENNEIAYAGQKPWHGLGFEVPAGTTGQKMLEIAGLNYELKLEDVTVNGNILSNYKAVTRGDNGTVFSIQSDRYHPVQNQEIVDLFREYCEAGHATMETVGAIRGGAIVWALARLNGQTKMTLAGNDKMEGYILFSSSNDGTLPTMGMPTQVRVVCNNTYQAALRDNRRTVGFRMKHSTKWTVERAKEAKSVLGIAIEDILRFNELSAKLSTVNIDEKGRIEFILRLNDGKYVIEDKQTKQLPDITVPSLDNADWIKSVLGTVPDLSSAFAGTDKLNRVGKAINESILTSPGSDLESAKNTLWGCVNGVSYYTDHIAARTQDSRLFNSWFGTAQGLKESAIDVACELAGIRG
jgi:phage/plasmid-like protein (TIGR03299 family)